jgi:ASC-1-like (ASCH) protein
MKIIKKVQEKYFNEVKEGRKRFEIRLADFKCKQGDTLVLKEQKQGTKILTGRQIELEILYKLNTKKIEKFYSRQDIEKYGLLIMGIRKKYN